MIPEPHLSRRLQKSVRNGSLTNPERVGRAALLKQHPERPKDLAADAFHRSFPDDIHPHLQGCDLSVILCLFAELVNTKIVAQNKSFSANCSCRDEVLVKVVAPALSVYE